MANQCWPTPPLDLSNTISRSGSVSWRVIFPFPSILVHARICALLEWRLCFPWPCWDPIIKSHWASKVRFTGGSHSFCQIPRLGSLKWGSEPSQQWDNFLGIIILQIVNRPPGRYWICLLSCFWSSYHLFFFFGFFFIFGCGISFSGQFQHPPVNGCSIASCDLGALVGGDECMSFYSIILNWQSLSSQV